ncbi:MAG TPA: ribonuclease HI [Firmicutes bacterium]|nr:ribonuclease HI [Bacillota bacterium]
MKEVIIYTDGACSGNPGPGGWGAILIAAGIEKELSGGETNTTNQRMELQAAIEALSVLKFSCRVKLHSDSAYLINAFRQNWLRNWQANGWLNSQKKPVENQDLWFKLVKLNQQHHIEWIKVAGHQDNIYNNRCDLLAKNAVKH